MQAMFVSDIHGDRNRYHKLLEKIMESKPSALFIGGDIFPHGFGYGHNPDNFFSTFFRPEFEKLQNKMGEDYPAIFLILGNDDGLMAENEIIESGKKGLWNYLKSDQVEWNRYSVYGYAYVPPTPFQLKDLEKYDVSRYVDPGCISPEMGVRSVPVTNYEKKYGTIARDLEKLTGDADLSDAIMLFHTPPHKTKLDKADLEGKSIDHAPLDPHVGSIAVRKLLEQREPLISLHGHIHESSRLTGSWRDVIGRTHCFNASHDGPELAVIEFDPANPDDARRYLL